MSALPVYEVEFIPLERRLGDRRLTPRDAALPSLVLADRRKVVSRRSDERRPVPLKAI